jgi:hypothetical protein
MQDTMLGSYAIENLSTDAVKAIGPFTVTTAIPIYAFNQVMGGVFTVETDTNGSDKLCCTKFIGSPLPLTIERADTSTYVLNPEPFTPMILLGSHPTIIQKPR